MSYKQAYDLQFRLADLRISKKIEDLILVLEHPPVITLGKFGKAENILASEEELANLRIAVCKTNRGGDVSFHCRGQLILYPIMDMRARGGEVRRFMEDLEKALVETVNNYGIIADPPGEHPGVWAGGKQLAAIGLHFRKGVSMHGISLNIDPPFKYFKFINLCGLPGTEATSMAQLINKNIEAEKVKRLLINNLSTILAIEPEWLAGEQAPGGVFE